MLYLHCNIKRTGHYNTATNTNTNTATPSTSTSRWRCLHQKLSTGPADNTDKCILHLNTFQNTSCAEKCKYIQNFNTNSYWGILAMYFTSVTVIYAYGHTKYTIIYCWTTWMTLCVQCTHSHKRIARQCIVAQGNAHVVQQGNARRTCCTIESW